MEHEIKINSPEFIIKYTATIILEIEATLKKDKRIIILK
jgi:hypothetical protein